MAVKIRVEREDPTGRYLIYAPTPEPDYDDDWLLDIRLYSHTFRADRASIILDELGLANQALRSHVEERKKFFDNKERFKKIQALVSPQDTEIDLDRKMLAVLVKADQPDPFTIVLALFHSLTRAALSTGGCAESKFLSLRNRTRGNSPPASGSRCRRSRAIAPSPPRTFPRRMNGSDKRCTYLCLIPPLLSDVWQTTNDQSSQSLLGTPREGSGTD
ncbi:MAG: hypothetical protein WCQ21_25010 [Verrucomicrobiota bacterium]